MYFFSPLRYPGGKGKLAPFLNQIFQYNNLNDGTYVEPYAGGAAVALSLLLKGYAWEIIINDIDPLVYSFWWSVLNDTEALARKISDARVNMKQWREQKAIIDNISENSVTEVGFATFFLNRTNRSGIIQGGVIGGKNQDGPYKIDARFNKKDLIQRINLIAKYKGRIKLFNLDAYELISNLAQTLSSKSLLYLDPPYFNKGKYLYRNYYSPADHAKIARLIQSLPFPWIVTYDNVPEICRIYEGESKAEFNISYSAYNDRPRGSEIMFYKKITLPSLPYTRKSQKTSYQDK